MMFIDCHIFFLELEKCIATQLNDPSSFHLKKNRPFYKSGRIFKKGREAYNLKRCRNTVSVIRKDLTFSQETLYLKF